MNDTENQTNSAEILIGKTIKEIKVSGYGIYLKTTDGIVLDYDSSDGGYSCWEIGNAYEEEEKERNEKWESA